MTVLVTGASGTVGRSLVAQLLEAGQRVRALTRDVTRANGLPAGVEMRQGDFHDPASLRAAMDGAESMYLFSEPATVHNVVSAAHDVDLEHMVVLTSGMHDEGEGADTRNPVEEAVRESGVEWTSLRPGPFAMNARDWWADPIREYGTVRWVHPGASLAPIHEADIAAVAVTALLEQGHAGQRYTLTGPEALTQAEQVETIGRETGQDLKYQEISEEEARGMLIAAGATAELSDQLLPLLASLVGTTAEVTATVDQVTGRPARTFAQWVGDHAEAFTAPRTSRA